MLARGRIQRDHAAGRRGRVEHAVDHERRGFLRLERPERTDPRNAQLAGVLAVDLSQRAIPGVGVVPSVRHPLVPRLRQGRRRRDGQRQSQYPADPFASRAKHYFLSPTPR